MIFQIGIFIPYLCFVLIAGGYQSILKELSAERIGNFFYAYQQATRLNIDVEKFLLLQACESRGITNAQGDYRNETGEYISNGIYQFQKSTFNKYSEKYNWQGEYLNPQHQSELAAFMISQGLWRAWYNCGKIVKLNQ